MKIVITGRDFGTYDRHAVTMLEEAGYEVIDCSVKNFGSGTGEQEIIQAAKDADIVIAGLEPYNENVLNACTNLKMISRRGIGYDNIPLDICKKMHIAVSRTVGAVEGAVAEHVLAYILYFSRRIDLQNQTMQEGRWQRIMMPGAKNHVLGLVGFGGIGKEIAKRAVPFGMKVAYYCRHPKKEWEREYGVTYLPLEELLAASDYVSINMPLTEETRGMFNMSLLRRMKEGSYLINIARDPIVEEKDLREALLSKHLAGAAIDVFDKEPCTDSLLVGLDNVVLTPHTAPYTRENFVEMNNIAAQNVLDFLNGKLQERNRLV